MKSGGIITEFPSDLSQKGYLSHTSYKLMIIHSY
jgi:hypothetical protein